MCDHHETTLKIDNRSKLGKSPNIWKLNYILLNNPQIKQKVKR